MCVHAPSPNQICSNGPHVPLPQEVACGTTGMKEKLAAARQAAANKIGAVIANGNSEDVCDLGPSALLGVSPWYLDLASSFLVGT